MTLQRRSLLALAAGALGPSAALLSPSARAADAYPNHALRWIVAYPAAGGSDFLARQLAPQMARQMGQTIVVDNRPGAAGIIGTEAASKQPGDGYTLLTGDNGAMVFHTALYKTLPYNPSDFVPLGFMASFPLILVVNPNAGFTSAAQLLDAVKKSPGKYSYASPGAGSPHHLAMELLKQRTGSFIVHVPYRGTAPAMQDVMSGQVPIMVVDTAAGLAQIKGGKLKALAVTSAQRSAALPDVPTIAEAGPVKGFDASSWFGLFAPTGTPPDIGNRIQQETAKAFQSPAFKERLVSQGAIPGGQPPAEFVRFIAAETKKWAQVVKVSGAKVD
ncbi:MAG: tripartite tricarboxylate transporter substrate binding protein [Caulobacter sp.]|nr:tripartite tricarboxylate transporter substrate binding protein [Vitreoscilla sp.]